MSARLLPAGLALLAAGCARPAATTPAPNMDPGRIGPAAVVPPPPPKEPVLPPNEAHRRGLMPLGSTNVWAFRQARPETDGRGVLIAILDSGIDPGIPGLGQTSTGDRKLLDLRDFSAEGRIALAPLSVRRDTAQIGAVRLAGIQRVVSVATGTVYGGVLAERPLGERPASDVNGDGDNADQLAVVVARASDGWVLFTDTDGDGSLANERPVRDYLVGRETFGWSTGGKPAPLTVAANFGGTGAPPVLDLFFDTSGHGSHVAGIAAGAGLYGVAGFDGVAPGAQLLGLKIAVNAFGGVSVTGSFLRAMDYAIRFARERRMPLVINLSFGVGNEREGRARIDAIVDSVLGANPELVFVTSAGNDGPGLSTMGFPGSADRAISVGASYPAAFVGGGAAAAEAIAFFSARGGELAKPDILAPGIAYSSVPRWDVGNEDKSGTSMASPHVAGAVALILSGLRQERISWTGAQVKQAILASGRPMGNALRVDQGAGLLDVVAADRILRRLPAVAAVRVAVGGVPAGGVFRIQPPGGAADTVVTATVEGALGGPVRLTASAGWIGVPATLQLTPPTTTFPITVRASSLSEPGVSGGTVTGWATDTTIGPLFRIPVTVATPYRIEEAGTLVRASMVAAGSRRIVFPVDSGRPFRVRVSTTASGQEVLAFLHEPGGQPFREENGRPAGFGEQGAVYDVDGRDAQRGFYEAVTVAPPTAGAAVEIRLDQSPVSLGARRIRDTVVAEVGNLARAAAAGTVALGLTGAERRIAFAQRGSAERRVTLRAPAWARRVTVELTMNRATWPLFTDLALTVLDAAGQVVVNAPMNYAFGRGTAELDSTRAGRDLTIVLAPGFADPAAEPMWDADLAIRFYAEAPTLLEPIGPEQPLALDPGARRSFRYSLARLPLTLGDGFFPVGQLVVDLGGTLWAREVPLPDTPPPLMR